MSLNNSDSDQSDAEQSDSEQFLCKEPGCIEPFWGPCDSHESCKEKQWCFCSIHLGGDHNFETKDEDLSADDNSIPSFRNSTKIKATASRIGKRSVEKEILIKVFEALDPILYLHGKGFGIKDKQFGGINAELAAEVALAMQPESMLDSFTPACIRRQLKSYIKSNKDAKAKWGAVLDATNKKKATAALVKNSKIKKGGTKALTATTGAGEVTIRKKSAAKPTDINEKDNAEESETLLAQVAGLMDTAVSIDNLLRTTCAININDTTIAANLFDRALLTRAQFQHTTVTASEELYTAVGKVDTLIEAICNAIPEKDTVRDYLSKNVLHSTTEFQLRFKPSQAVDMTDHAGGPDVHARRNRDLDSMDFKWIRKSLLRSFFAVVNATVTFTLRIMAVQTGTVSELEAAGDKEEELSGFLAGEIDRIDVDDEKERLEAEIEKAKELTAKQAKAYLRALQALRLLEQQRDRVQPRDEKASCIAMVMRPAFGGARLSYSHANFQGEEEPLSPLFQSIIVAKMASPSTVAADIKGSKR